MSIICRFSFTCRFRLKTVLEIDILAIFDIESTSFRCRCIFHSHWAASRSKKSTLTGQNYYFSSNRAVAEKYFCKVIIKTKINTEGYNFEAIIEFKRSIAAAAAEGGGIGCAFHISYLAGFQSHYREALIALKVALPLSITIRRFSFF